MEDNGSLLPEL